MNRNIRIAIYAIAAVVALYGVCSQSFTYGPSLKGFLPDAKVNAASRSLAIDTFMMFFSASALMVYEARRLNVRFAWAYIFIGYFSAIAFTFPLFLIAREFALSREATVHPGLVWYDYAGLVLVTGVVGSLYWYLLFA